MTTTPSSRGHIRACCWERGESTTSSGPCGSLGPSSGNGGIPLLAPIGIVLEEAVGGVEDVHVDKERIDGLDSIAILALAPGKCEVVGVVLVVVIGVFAFLLFSGAVLEKFVNWTDVDIVVDVAVDIVGKCMQLIMHNRGWRRQ